MADTSVYINGINEDAFKSAVESLPSWASQATLEEIHILLEKSNSTQNKIYDELSKGIASGGKGSPTSDDLNKKLGEYIDLQKDLNKQAEEEKDLAAKKAKQDKAKLDQDTKSEEKGKAWGKLLGALVSAGKLVEGAQLKYASTSDALYKSGINLLAGQDATQSSTMSLNQMIKDTGLRLETLQAVVLKYTASINAVGINKFSTTLKSANKDLTALGYSTEQQAELLGTLIESESSYTDIRGKTAGQLAEDSKNLGKQLNILSLTTGQSNEKLQANLIALSKDTDSMVVSAIYGEKAAERMNVFSDSFQDADVGKMFQKLAATETPQITQAFMAMQQAGLGSLAQQFTDIATAARNGSISAIEANRRVTDLANQQNSDTMASLSRLANAGVAGAQEALTVVTKLRQQGNTTGKASEQQMTAAQKNEAAISEWTSAIEKSRSLVEVAFPILETQITAAAKNLGWFNEKVMSVIDIFDPITRSYIAMGIAVVGAGAGFIAAAKGTAAGLWNIADTILPSVTGGLKNFATSILSSVNSISSLAGKAGLLGLALYAGYEAGTWIYNHMLADWASFQTLSDSIFGAIDNILQNFSSDAKERVEARKKAENEKNNSANSETHPFIGPPTRESIAASDQKAKASNISVPKAPMASTINSPSSASTDNQKDSSAPVTSGDVPTSSASTSSGIEKPPTTSDINSLITYQNNLTAQLLISVNKLISVDSEILKFTRQH